MTQPRIVREIEHELRQLERVAEIAICLSQVSESERQPWDSAAASKYISDVFLGLENLCKRRMRSLGKTVPVGADSHSALLNDFLQTENLGGQLSDDVKVRLKKYLRFRHRFSHGYGFEVSWEIAEEPLRLLPDTVAIIADVWRHWIKGQYPDTE